MKKKIYYWSPFLVRIATPRAVVNSAYAMQKFSKLNHCSIINFFGEFNIFKEELMKKEINTINYFKSSILKILPKYGKILSRFSFIVIFILSFFPLKKLISKEKPDYLIIHLITSLPLLLLLIFNFETKFVLRISGLPKIGFFRKLLWRLALKKIYIITCPTKNTLEYIKNFNFINSNNVKLLYDPIIEVNKILKKKRIIDKKISFNNKEYYFAAGRLTKQKNFLFLCKCFKLIVDKDPSQILVIAGEGENKSQIMQYIRKNNLKKNIVLTGHLDNIYYHMCRSKVFILSSLWEDPGFVIVEAAFCRVPIISSDCDNGPKELIKDSINGILFKSNNIENFLVKFDEIIKLKNFNKLLLNNLKMSKKFTLFNHYLNFKKILNDVQFNSKDRL